MKLGYGAQPHLEPLRRQRFRFMHKKTPTRGGAYSGISIHAAHTGTTAHSYAVLGLVVYWFFRFPLCVIGRPLSLNLNEAEPKEKAERRWQKPLVPFYSIMFFFIAAA